MALPKPEVLQGTLDLMVLKSLAALRPLHGYGIARRIEQVSDETLRLNEGTVYQSLLRIHQKGWITSEWGASENNRRAKFYSVTKSGAGNLPGKRKAGIAFLVWWARFRGWENAAGRPFC